MRGRYFKLALLCWTIAWYGYTVPAHQRGQILLPGGNGMHTISALASCCVMPTDVGDAGNPAGAPTDSSVPNKGGTAPTGRCAICFMATVIVSPPPLTLYEPVLALLRMEAANAPAKPFVCDTFERRHGRAPPTLSAVI